MNKQGFTLIELLIVVVIIGIVAAIAIPNLLTALDRGKQKATMADARLFGLGIESYSIDNFIVPHCTIEQLDNYLIPMHIRATPEKDGWGNGWFYTYAQQDDNKGDVYSVGSGGKDGIINWDLSGTYVVQTKMDFYKDIIYSMGAYSRAPNVK